MYFFVKKYSKNSGCRLAGRHLLCSQVASDILRSLRGLPLAVCRKCLGRQRLAALKHVSGLPAHCSTCSLRRRNAAFCFTKFGCARCVTCKQACVTLAGTNFRFQRRITFAAVNHSESNSRSNLLKNGTVWAWVVVSGKRGKRTGNVWALGKQRCTVNAHSELPRSRICRVKTTTAKTKRPERKALFESWISVPALWFFRVTKEHKRNSLNWENGRRIAPRI